MGRATRLSKIKDIPAPSLAANLTARELRFCLEYLIDFNGLQAALRAGFAPRSAAARGTELINRASVSKYLNKAISIKLQKLDQDSDRLLLELARMAHCDLGQAFASDGSFLPLTEMPEDVRRCIAGIETAEEYDDYFENEDGPGVASFDTQSPPSAKRSVLRRVVIRKIKFWDKNKAADTLAKCLKLFTQTSVNINVSLESLVVDSIEAASQRRAGQVIEHQPAAQLAAQLAADHGSLPHQPALNHPQSVQDQASIPAPASPAGQPESPREQAGPFKSSADSA